MKLKFFRTGDDAWKEVQDKILKSIEQEQKANQIVVVTSAGEITPIEETQPKTDIYTTAKTSTASDSSWVINGGIQ